ncbi:MAG TPA: hypothetical protein VGO53_08665 [Steroidobacteraceae bacterium]|jgi:hypothetical protein|nr:hypothetical protein [Steroidobacteraceae bacterium]
MTARTTNDEGSALKTHELEVSMEAAAVLLSLAMRDTENPVADLGNALSRMLTELRSGHGAPHAEGDIAICIESLQFHDRLIQQLAAVRNLLASVVNDGPLDVSGFGAKRWEEMLTMLRDRLSVDSQHQLFNLLMRTGVVDFHGRPSLEAQEGSVELF